MFMRQLYLVHYKFLENGKSIMSDVNSSHLQKGQLLLSKNSQRRLKGTKFSFPIIKPSYWNATKDEFKTLAL